MSVYQYVAFRAIDRPLTDRELVYAQKQSSRAEVTRWYFENEYHYGDFRGDANGLLRHGFDVHLHYANFGLRRIAIRLPNGIPFPKSVWSKYLRRDSLFWRKDSKGKGGILTVDPFHEPGEIEEIWSPRDYLDDVIEIRNRLLSGDLRAFYLLWLCAANDQDAHPGTIEPPVPGGLAECIEPCGALMEFFGLDPFMLLAAAKGAPAVTESKDQKRSEAWIDSLDETERTRFLRRFLTEDAAAVKAEILAAMRQSSQHTDWPTAALERSLQELLERAQSLCDEHEAETRREQEAAARCKAEKQEKDRQERMKQMVRAPQKWLREATKLVEARGTKNYNAAADILADLCEAVGGGEGVQITHKHAAHLVKKHPTLNHLKSSLRKRGLLG